MLLLLYIKYCVIIFVLLSIITFTSRSTHQVHVESSLKTFYYFKGDNPHLVFFLMSCLKMTQQNEVSDSILLEIMDTQNIMTVIKLCSLDLVLPKCQLFLTKGNYLEPNDQQG